MVGVATGVKQAVEALTATTINKGSGEIPSLLAAKSVIGAIKIAVAELLIAWLKREVTRKIPARSAVG